MKRMLAAVVCAAVVACFSTQAEAGEPGKIKGSLLNKMGLGQAKVMTAAEGDQVRGSFTLGFGAGFGIAGNNFFFNTGFQNSIALPGNLGFQTNNIFNFGPVSFGFNFFLQ